jgi:hypothetical protein
MTATVVVDVAEGFGELRERYSVGRADSLGLEMELVVEVEAVRARCLEKRRRCRKRVAERPDSMCLWVRFGDQRRDARPGERTWCDGIRRDFEFADDVGERVEPDGIRDEEDHVVDRLYR